MVDIKMDLTEENLKEYVRYTVFLKNKFFVIALISFAVFGVLTVALCLAAFFLFNYMIALIFAGIIVFIEIGFAAFLIFNINSCSKRVLKANAESELKRVMISEDDIIVFNDSGPIGNISWNKMAEIYFNEKAQAVYLTTERNAALILECSNILSGTADELKEIIGKKRDELSKKA